jgi:glycosyltransferase involved in cell wall biosynthesis
MNYPPISCRCITYGRINFLEEAIESFLKQQYPGKKELIIVNDYPLQTLVFDHPEVKIYNLDYTFDTLGEKENFTVDKCSYDIIALWDDDDIALPNHLSNIAKFWKEDTYLLQWHRGVFMNIPNIAEITGLGNAGMVYSKKIWNDVGKYPLENAGHDMTFIMSIKRNIASSSLISANPPDDEVSFFYVWGGRDYHASGMGTDTPDRPNIIQRHKEHIELKRQKGEIPIGEIVLNPNWKYNYKNLLNEFIKTN